MTALENIVTFGNISMLDKHQLNDSIYSIRVIINLTSDFEIVYDNNDKMINITRFCAQIATEDDTDFLSYSPLINEYSKKIFNEKFIDERSKSIIKPNSVIKQVSGNAHIFCNGMYVTLPLFVKLVVAIGVPKRCEILLEHMSIISIYMFSTTTTSITETPEQKTDDDSIYDTQSMISFYTKPSTVAVDERYVDMLIEGYRKSYNVEEFVTLSTLTSRMVKIYGGKLSSDVKKSYAEALVIGYFYSSIKHCSSIRDTKTSSLLILKDSIEGRKLKDAVDKFVQALSKLPPKKYKRKDLHDIYYRYVIDKISPKCYLFMAGNKSQNKSNYWSSECHNFIV